MTESRPSLSIHVDPTNPGQFFACCGLLELADRMAGGAEGAFSADSRTFTITGQAGAGSESPTTVVSQLISCEITSTMNDEQIARLKRLLNQKKTTLTTEDLAEKEQLSDLWDRERIHLPKPFNLYIDWWNDGRAGGSDFKTWAGKQFVRDLVRAMQAAIRFGDWASLSPGDWIRQPTNQGILPLYFDSDIGGQSSSIDVGFSMDALDMRSRTRPLLELAAFVGLQRFRPLPNSGGESFTYCLWTEPLVPLLASIACCGLLPQNQARAFEFRLLYRTKYLKSFLPGIPKEVRQ